MIKRILLLAALLVVGLGATTSSAGATPQDQVTICHRTDSAKHPYAKITVDEDAVDGEEENNGNQADHYGEHQGQLVTSTAEAQDLKDADEKWGDIIPPVGEHKGLNFTEAGQKILDNDCRLVGEAPDDIVVVTIKESLDCDTKKVSVTTTTTTTTYEKEIIVEENNDSRVKVDDTEWVAQEPVIVVEDSIRDATNEELATCPDDGEVLGTTVVKNLPYTGGDATLASVITFSTIAAAIAGTSVVARRTLGSKI